jgi:hypothetical protein
MRDHKPSGRMLFLPWMVRGAQFGLAQDTREPVRAKR